MSEFRIRHLEPGDEADLSELYGDASVYGNTLQLPYPSEWKLGARMDGLLRAGRYQLVCEADGDKMVGSAGLWRLDDERLSHIAGLGIVVHRGWQGRGVGKLLMAALLDLADNWIGFERVELTVYPDNLAAQALYRRFGFVEEGRLRAHSFRNGAYHDALLMGRLRGDRT